MPINLVRRVVAVVSERTAFLSTGRKSSTEPFSEYLRLGVSSSILLLNVTIESEDCCAICNVVGTADSR